MSPTLLWWCSCSETKTFWVSKHAPEKMKDQSANLLSIFWMKVIIMQRALKTKLRLFVLCTCISGILPHLLQITNERWQFAWHDNSALCTFMQSAHDWIWFARLNPYTLGTHLPGVTVHSRVNALKPPCPDPQFWFSFSIEWCVKPAFVPKVYDYSYL